MTDWSDASTANPVDLRKAAAHIAAQTGFQPTVIYMTRKRYERHQAWMELQARLQEELDDLPSWAHIRRIKLERKKGFWSWRRYLPVRVRRLMSDIEHRHDNWKRRNDPYWEPW
jgi:hypothetical protein